MNKIISKLKEFFDDVFYPNSNLLKINHYPPVPKMKVQYQRFKESKSMEELKRCPFCGHNAEIRYTEWNNYSKGAVKCRKCSARMELSTLKRSIEAWNRRASD